jgi:multiple sugar transport system permease protein
MTAAAGAETYQRAQLKLGWWLGERPVVWILPLAIVLAVFYLFPAVDVVRFSFTDATLLNPEYEFTTDTYASVLGSPDLPGILWVTFLFVVGSVVFQLLLGLGIALALHRGKRRRLWGTNALRVIILAAWIIPGIASGIAWRLLLNESNHGFLNGVLRWLDIGTVRWLSDTNIALLSATIANIWRGTAFSMILLYAGLQVIPRSLYDAASVDGATAPKQFWYITLPQLRPILIINTVLISIFTLNSFDLILPLTGGGPGRATEVLSLYTYNSVFRNYDLSSGSVLAVLMLVISIGFTAIYLRFLPKEE